MKNKIPPPVLMLFTGTIMWFVARSEFATAVEIPPTIAIAGALLLAACGIAIDVSAFLQFRKAKTTVNPLKPENASSLVRSGIFAKTRNPMYLGMIFILAGWALWLGSLTNIAVLVLFVPLITFLQIKPEEVVLQQLFSEEFSDYLDAVPRWLW
jgi:protein-S-isoprenylcysteine O-methyltransferase Ste14